MVRKGIMPMILDPLSLILKAAHEACRATSPGALIAGAIQNTVGAVTQT